jgi:CelD/BcsL family acetyltransferase involved in cellulose biosynthesis
MQTTTYNSPSELLAQRHSKNGAPEQEIVNLLDDWNRIQPLWDRYIAEHPKGNVFHTSQMARVFKGTPGHKPVALASLAANGTLSALLVSVRVQTLPSPLGWMSSRAIFYAEPLCREHPDSMKALSELVAFHDRSFGRTVLFAEVRPLFAPGPERIVLERAGYEYLEYLNYINDVTLPVKTMWSNLHKGAQYAVRQCEKRGLVAREVPIETAVDQLYPLLKLSYKHSGVPLADRGLFDATVREASSQRMVKFFAVFEDDQPVAMDVLLIFKDQIYLWYGGVSRSCEGSPCTLLRWHELKWAHEQGYAVCDSGGAGWPNVPYGVRDFKRKFGGNLVQFGRYRKTFSPRTLAIAEKAYNLKRKWFAAK